MRSLSSNFQDFRDCSNVTGRLGLGPLNFGLAEALEEPHAGSISVKGIDVVDHDELVAVPVELGGSTLNVMNITSVLHRPVQHRHESPNWCMSWIVQFQPLDLGMTDQNAQRS